MSQFIEFVGKNMDKALEKASNELNIPVEDLSYDVVSYGSSGIFGLVGAKKAKIRVKKQTISSVDSETRSRAKDLVNDAFDLEKKKPKSTRTQAAKTHSAKVQPAKTHPAKTQPAKAQQKAEPKKTKPVKKEALAEIPPADLEKAVDIGQEALQRFADFITTDGNIVSEVKDQRIIFRIEGGNSGLLIGKRGQTLEAMQYLTEKIVNKQSEQRVRVLVDVEGYLKTRKANLQKMASKMADKAKKSNKPVTIGQMNAYDRRTVHMHLKSNNAVRTQSVGDGYYRKLIIFPKKNNRRRNARQSS